MDYIKRINKQPFSLPMNESKQKKLQDPNDLLK